MTTATERQFSFPQIHKFSLRNFSLFTRRSEIDIDFYPGVMCVVGANGLGKSTLVAAANYALTGRVPDPTRTFESADEYYRFTEDFTRSYFAGRIKERDRGAAQVSLRFSINGTRYGIVRDVFEPNSLRELIVEGEDVSTLRMSVTEGDDPGAIQARYASIIQREVGVPTYEHFVFLQLFLLTFDERRNLTFWSPRVLEQILFLGFSLDPDSTVRVGQLHREFEKHDSIVRNVQWQATQTRKRIVELESFLKRQTSPSAELTEQYDYLQKALDEEEIRFDRVSRELEDARTKLAEFAARAVSLEREYEEAFTRLSDSQVGISRHPLIVTLLQESVCPVCRTIGDQTVRNVRDALGARLCPLCRTPVQTDPGVVRDSDIERLAKIDAELAGARREAQEREKTASRLGDELEKSRQSLAELRRAFERFEAENESFMAALRTRTPDTAESLQALRTQYQILQQAKQEARTIRDATRSQLTALQLRLNREYEVAKEHFIPKFKVLAKSFLGLDLDVTMDTRAGQVTLVLEIEQQIRRQPYQLSESQRLFVDIALRMALSQQMSIAGAPAMMVIDTPEGSLDAAYESRAGQMFAEFAFNGFNILMTANLNTSQLLQRLAEKCTRARMRLVRMMDWTDLSEVQTAEEELFDNAFAQIEAKLGGV